MDALDVCDNLALQLTCCGQQEEDDSQDVEGLPAGGSHLLVPTQ